jgi:pimeloyl-ACP methyl ester carboxylesterase
MKMMNKFSLIAAIFFLALAASGQVLAADSSAPPQGFVTVFGAKIHYVDQGKGPVVILIHGLGDNIAVWQASIAALSPKYRVIAYDQLGFGQSDKPIMAYRVGTLVDFLDGFMKALHIGRASLVGNSLGGWVAIDFALKYPEKVDRLVLVDSAGYAGWPSPEIANALRLASRADFEKLLPLTFFDKAAFASAEVIDEAFAQHIAAGDGYTIQQLLDSAARREDVIDGRVKKLKQPTLIVWGGADRLVPLDLGNRLHRDIANSGLYVIENCGHMSQVECPDKLNLKLLQFLGPHE